MAKIQSNDRFGFNNLLRSYMQIIKNPVSITANSANNECTFYDCKGSALI